MTAVWLGILQRQVEARGRAAVTRELDISTAALSLVLSGKYPASTQRIEERVERIYGEAGMVMCPHLGEISPTVCAEHWERAIKIKGAGNPATIRLYIACRTCSLKQNKRKKR